MPMTESVRERLSQGRADNPASWRWTVAFFEYVTTLPNGAHCQPLLRLAQFLAASDEAQNFRAGQSLYTLVISAKSENGLDTNDPRISIALDRKSELIHLDYWLAEKPGGLAESHLCREAEVWEYLLPLLARLWNDTHGRDQPVDRKMPPIISMPLCIKNE